MINYTAKNSGYYKVFVNDVQVSKHITEREALESGANQKLLNISSKVRITHDYEVDVSINVYTANVGNINVILEDEQMSSSGTTTPASIPEPSGELITTILAEAA